MLRGISPSAQVSVAFLACAGAVAACFAPTPSPDAATEGEGEDDDRLLRPPEGEAEPEPCAPECVEAPCTDRFVLPPPPRLPDPEGAIDQREGCDIVETDAESRPVLYQCDDDETLAVEYDPDGRIAGARSIADGPNGLTDRSWAFTYDELHCIQQVVDELRDGAFHAHNTLAASFVGEVPVLEERRLRFREQSDGGDARFLADGIEAYHLVRAWRPDGLFMSSELRGDDDEYLAERIDYTYDDDDRLVRVDTFIDDPAVVGNPPGCARAGPTSYQCSTLFFYDDVGGLVRMETGDQVEAVSDNCCAFRCEP